MQWLYPDQSVFYALVWAVGFLSSLFGTFGNPDAQPYGKCFFIAGVSGFLAFSIVAIRLGDINSPLTGQWRYLGLASLIGLGSQFHPKILRYALVRFNLLPKEDVERNDPAAKD